MRRGRPHKCPHACPSRGPLAHWPHALASWATITVAACRDRRADAARRPNTSCMALAGARGLSKCGARSQSSARAQLGCVESAAPEEQSAKRTPARRQMRFAAVRRPRGCVERVAHALRARVCFARGARRTRPPAAGAARAARAKLTRGWARARDLLRARGGVPIRQATRAHAAQGAPLCLGSAAVGRARNISLVLILGLGAGVEAHGPRRFRGTSARLPPSARSSRAREQHGPRRGRATRPAKPRNQMRVGPASARGPRAQNAIAPQRSSPRVRAFSGGRRGNATGGEEGEA